MMKMLEYKGYLGSVEYSEEDGVLFGEVLGIKSSISYDGETMQELTDCFHMMIDDYLISCEEEGVAPEKTDTDRVAVFLSSDLYKSICEYAIKHKITPDSFMESALSAALGAS